MTRNGRTVTCGGMRIIQKISSTGFVIFNVNNAQEWTDSNMRWDEAEYGGVKDIRVPPSSLWKPDILMYNRLDLNFFTDTKSFKMSLLPHHKNLR